MKYPSKTLFGLTWFGWINFVILQWFFIRLQARIEETDNELVGLDLRFIVPLTGWWQGYLPKKRIEMKLWRKK